MKIIKQDKAKGFLGDLLDLRVKYVEDKINGVI